MSRRDCLACKLEESISLCALTQCLLVLPPQCGGITVSSCFGLKLARSCMLLPSSRKSSTVKPLKKLCFKSVFLSGLILTTRSLKYINRGNDFFRRCIMKSHTIEPRNHNHNGTGKMTRVVKYRASCFRVVSSPEDGLVSRYSACGCVH